MKLVSSNEPMNQNGPIFSLLEWRLMYERSGWIGAGESSRSVVWSPITSIFDIVVYKFAGVMGLMGWIICHAAQKVWSFSR